MEGWMEQKVAEDEKKHEEFVGDIKCKLSSLV